MVRLIRSLGAKAILENGVLKIRPGNNLKPFAPHKLVKTMRGQFVCGSVAREAREAEVSLPDARSARGRSIFT